MEQIMITGANGRVGSAIKEMLDKLEYKIIATDMNEVDVTDLEQLRLFVDMNRPDIIINCSGLTDVEECERNIDLAYKINALGARNLSIVSRKVGARLVQLSTDDIFGEISNKPYNEFDTPTPINVYGKSKLAGENFVRELCPKHIIVRSSWVYGVGNDFLHKVLNAAKSGKDLSVPNDQYGIPTSAIELAKVVQTLIREELDGVFHIVCSGDYCSRYEFAKEILNIVQSDIKLIPTSNQINTRPSYSVLDNLMLRISDIEQPMDWKLALKQYLL